MDQPGGGPRRLCPGTDGGDPGVAGGGDHTVPVVFDTDMDFDDAAALAYLSQEHKRGRIQLRAVTITNSGVGCPGSPYGTPGAC